MRGDVDGDSHDDVSAVVHKRLTKGRERIFLVVKTRNETLRSWMGDIADPAPANVAALAQIDSKAGAELVVQDWAGASEAGYTLYTVRKGRLVRIRTPYGYRPIQVGGSAASGEDYVNCPYGPSTGTLLVGGSYLYASKPLVEIRRELWRLEGTRFVRVRSFDRTYSRKDLGPDSVAPEHVPGFPALESWEFAGCGVYPGGKAL
ncbi:MAG: hypothetical protein ABSB96_07010 [Gaiellaceae bacterium]